MTSYNLNPTGKEKMKEIMIHALKTFISLLLQLILCGKYFTNHECAETRLTAVIARYDPVSRQSRRVNELHRFPWGKLRLLQAHHQGWHEQKGNFIIHKNLQHTSGTKRWLQSLFTWKFVSRARKGFATSTLRCDFSAKLLPRLRANYPHSHNSFSLDVYVGIRINESPNTHKPNTVIRAHTANKQKTECCVWGVWGVWACTDAHWQHILWEYAQDQQPSGEECSLCLT